MVSDDQNNDGRVLYRELKRWPVIDLNVVLRMALLLWLSGCVTAIQSVPDILNGVQSVQQLRRGHGPAVSGNRCSGGRVKRGGVCQGPVEPTRIKVLTAEEIQQRRAARAAKKVTR